jgi:hypothetical protein
MKYIKKLNIDFDQWNKLKNECTYLIFKSSYNLYLGYILNINKINNSYYGNVVDYGICLLNHRYIHDLNVIHNIKEINDNDLIHYNNKTIKYKDLIKTDFYKNNKILIIGINVSKKDILKNPKIYEVNYNCLKNQKIK